MAIYRAIDDNNVNILNVSYSACEQELGAAGNQQVLNAWEQAAAQGITVTVSSGDNGSAGCDNQNTATAATGGFGVNGLASTPYNIAVGGTDFDVLSGKFSTYVGSSSMAPYTTALSYIPENSWNDSTSVNSTLASNVALLSNGSTSIWVGSGGASRASNGSTGYAKPAWQQQFSPSDTDTVRDLPDVSLFSGAGHYGALWALCENSDCAEGAGSSIHGVGGTSAAAPAFAGMLALINQKVGASTRLGQANWILYDLAAAAPGAFHQITTGNNSVVCKSGSPDCGSNDFMTGYNAGSGYNLATGLGSVDVSKLIQAWGDDSLTATSTSLSLGQTTFTHGTPVGISVAVTPSGTGSVAIETNYASQAAATGGVSPTSLTLSGGTASGSYGQFPGGSYNVTANYGGDGSHSGSVSQPVQVTVSPRTAF
ncbi:Ig-like domain repeat protein [Terracidiphilus gabretensis]|uniref:Ig-like domain repeat protein n=1 Tax=Terracidiphilus gabretensis TaxID=1577687 RepID=UPI0012F9E06A|nr:Ig-like domain repeat protein [Terracidiphilus gabretensis]